MIEPDENDFLLVHALLTGSPATPYEKGFYYFLFGFPNNYPYSPPRVKLMTTGGGKVRFNPNLYASGKVCLSILGTYFGPEWSGSQGLRSVLLSIQCLMNERPYSNEPGFEKEKKQGDIEKYNDMIRHDNIKVAVLDMVGGSLPNMPESFKTHIQQAFFNNYSFYEETILGNISLTGRPIEDPLYHQERGCFEYDRLLDSLESMKCSLMKINDAQKKEDM
ncbi:Ubiquitin-conjugating enzyme E2 Z [Frankliniella fusca]|uniref:Ubiquitin-conjugating enzyme E2 Z n=1 Tax=Frankliniella fusca TaxID=407009 RepID=A0AAE1HYY8_9NEOP|nr:Ubiquitin-conjugating enzyme E2 Z [Frankliniella fusca]